MTNIDIIAMAREAEFDELPFDDWTAFTHNIERFAALVAAAAKTEEREACAKVCDVEADRKEAEGTWLWEARRCAAAIRARGETK